MSAPRRILFLCTGNVCRSAIAEHLLRHLAARRGLALEVESRGLAAQAWYRVPEPARRLLAEAGVPPFEHRPRLLTRDALRWADLALAMAREHRDAARDRFPEFSSKVRLLNEHVGLPADDIADPMGGPDEAFAACFTRIQAALEALLDGKLGRSP